MKTCSRCREVKPLVEFSTCRGKHGYWCRSCVADRSLDRRARVAAGGAVRPMRRFTLAERDLIMRDHGEGRNTRQIAASLGAKVAAVVAFLRREGVKMRGSRKHSLDESYLDTIDTPAKARWLGFLAADGCISSRYGRDRPGIVSIGLERGDRAHVEAFRDAIGYTGPIYDLTRKKKGRTTLVSNLAVASVRLAAAAMAQGLGFRKSLVLEPWEGPPELMRHWWAGLIDGDGHLFRSPATWHFGLTGSLATVRAFADYVCEQAGDRKKPQPHGNVFTVRYNRLRTVQQLARLFYANLEGGTPLARKLEAAEEMLATEPKRCDFTSLTRERLLELHREHCSWAKVALELGTSTSAIGRLAIRRGLSVSLSTGIQNARGGRVRESSLWRYNELARLYQSGMTMTEASAALGYRTDAACYKALKALGIQVRPRHSPSPGAAA